MAKVKKKRGRPALVEDPERRSIRLGKKDWQALADSTKEGSWSDRVSELLASHLAGHEARIAR